MSASSEAKATVLRTLRDEKALAIKPFAISGVGFGGNVFPILAGFIDRGSITVEYDSSKNGMAEYDYGTNTILLGFQSTTEPTKSALIVHECTHAAYDIVRQRMTVAASEAIAYVVQCQYLVAIFGDGGNRLMSPDPAKDKVFELAWRIAATIQNGNRASDQDKSKLLDAVSRHPYYMGKSAGDAGYNGVSEFF